MCPLFPRHSLMTLHHLHICLYMLFLPSLWLFSFIFNVVNLTHYFHSLSDGTQPWCHFSCHAIETLIMFSSTATVSTPFVTLPPHLLPPPLPHYLMPPHWTLPAASLSWNSSKASSVILTHGQPNGHCT